MSKPSKNVSLYTRLQCYTIVFRTISAYLQEVIRSPPIRIKLSLQLVDLSY